MRSVRSLAVSRLDQRSEGRCGEQRTFRDSGRYDIVKIGKRGTDRISSVMINTIGDHRYGLRVIGPEFCDRALSGGADLLRAPVSAMHH